MNSMGVLGHGGEYRPRFGLWVDRSAECRQAVAGLLAEGFDCDVILKFGVRCPQHEALPFRPRLSLSEYWRLVKGPRVDLPIDAYPGRREDCTGRFGCYVREVFFPENLNLRRIGKHGD